MKEEKVFQFEVQLSAETIPVHNQTNWQPNQLMPRWIELSKNPVVGINSDRFITSLFNQERCLLFSWEVSHVFCFSAFPHTTNLSLSLPPPSLRHFACIPHTQKSLCPSSCDQELHPKQKLKPKQITLLTSKHIRQTSEPLCWILKGILEEQ